MVERAGSLALKCEGEGFEVMPAGVDVRDVDTKEEIDQAHRD